MKKYEIYEKNTDNLLYTGVAESGQALIEYYEDLLRKDKDIYLYKAIKECKGEIIINREKRKAKKKVEAYIETLPKTYRHIGVRWCDNWLGFRTKEDYIEDIELKHDFMCNHFVKLLEEFIKKEPDYKARGYMTNYCKDKYYLMDCSTLSPMLTTYPVLSSAEGYRRLKRKLKVVKVFLEVK